MNTSDQSAGGTNNGNRDDSGGVERRSRIDSETVQGLQLINGGMAAGLVAMLPHVLSNHSYTGLSRWMVAGVVFGALGLVSAVVHSRLRRKCSLEYSKLRQLRESPFTSRWLVWCQTVPAEPRICTKSIMAMWTSLAMFFFGAAVVCIGFLTFKPNATQPDMACWTLEQTHKGLARFNTCTGTIEHIEAP
jgi:hypothetical protein